MGLIGIFRRPYTVRRFTEQTVVMGYTTSGHVDSVERLNVQPLGPDELRALPEGERTIKRVKAFGDYAMRAADQSAGTPGDWLFYNGRWFECKSSVSWDHTMLSHYRSEFVDIQRYEAPPETGGKQ